ncbi:3-oxoadipate CoA-transferase subunit B [Pigmentiphaga humi]|uniref:3-oxoadipate CoA-transferase subunit B n=1 Tax=Pigmentiphaga humi TaxID=2478468 RepID=A0A3P4B7T0_9BURK|nr:CoA-transferase [Pigmentiphaga humi]VCU71670.1 3-oxoadipate CoA-transferase subunit B [Pigmentiphaga humi]
MERIAFFVCAIARMLKDRKHVAVGANSPLQAAAALAAQALATDDMRVSILGTKRHSSFASFGDLFDCAATGRLDAFFLSPGQIDGQANINMVGIGTYPRFDVRWPGSHGAPLLYMLIPNIILFKEEHSPRTLVRAVDFVSAPGTSPPNVYRTGGPTTLLTGKACFSFDPAAARFTLESAHPGVGIDEILANTGFEFDHPSHVPVTAPPEADMLDVIRQHVVPRIRELYPQFADSLLGSANGYAESAPGV